MILNDINAGLFEKEIAIGEFFGGEKEEGVIVFRGPNNDEWGKIQNANYGMISDKGMEVQVKGKKGEADRTVKIDISKTTDRMNIIFRIMKSCIKEQSFEVEKDGKVRALTNDLLWKEIEKRPDCVSHLVTEWVDSLPLSQKDKEQ